VYLGNTCTGDCGLLELGEYTIRAAWMAAELFLEYTGNVRKWDLRRIIEQLGELELYRPW